MFLNPVGTNDVMGHIITIIIQGNNLSDFDENWQPKCFIYETWLSMSFRKYEIYSQRNITFCYELLCLPGPEFTHTHIIIDVGKLLANV